MKTRNVSLLLPKSLGAGTRELAFEWKEEKTERDSIVSFSYNYNTLKDTADFSQKDVLDAIAKKYKISPKYITSVVEHEGGIGQQKVTISIPVHLIPKEFLVLQEVKTKPMDESKSPLRKLSLVGKDTPVKDKIDHSNFLSYQYQRNFLQGMADNIAGKLGETKEAKLTEKMDFPVLLRKLQSEKGDVNTNLDTLILGIKARLAELQNHYFQHLKTDEEAASKNLPENKSTLSLYLKQVQEVFKTAAAVLPAISGDAISASSALTRTFDKVKGKTINPRADSLQKAFQALLQDSKKQYDYIQKAAELQIYELCIPVDEYNKLISQFKPKPFYFDGKAKAAISKMGGTIIALPALLIGTATAMLPGGGPQLIDSTIFKGKGMKFLGKIADKGDEVYAKGQKAGDGIKRNFPREWIKELILEEDKDGTLVVEPNPHFKEFKDDNTVTAYTIHGGNPDDVFEHGTGFYGLGKDSPINPHGHVLYTLSFKMAQASVVERSSGDMFDLIAGDRLHNAWKSSELQPVYEAFAEHQSSMRLKP